MAERPTITSPTAAASPWKAAVADVASLPATGNTVNDRRTVLDDGDGKQAGYVWTGAAWVKIEDVDAVAVFGGAGAIGLVPDPGAESGLFLKDDGTFAAPPAGGFDPANTFILDAAGGFDATTLADALALITGPGQTIWVMPGTYTTTASTTFTSAHAGTTIHALGSGSVLFDKTSGAGACIFINNCDDVIFEGCRFRSNLDCVEVFVSNGTIFRHCTAVDGSNAWFINVSAQTDRVVLDHCHIAGASFNTAVFTQGGVTEVFGLTFDEAATFTTSPFFNRGVMNIHNTTVDLTTVPTQAVTCNTGGSNHITRCYSCRFVVSGTAFDMAVGSSTNPEIELYNTTISGASTDINISGGTANTGKLTTRGSRVDLAGSTFDTGVTFDLDRGGDLDITTTPVTLPAWVERAFVTNTGAKTVNLPPIARGGPPSVFIKRTTGTGTITLDGDGAETIDGSTTHAMTAMLSHRRIVRRTSTDWAVMGRNGG